MELSIAYEMYMPPHSVDTSKAMKIVSDAGFDAVDLSLGAFCLQNGAPLLSDNWKREAEKYIIGAEENSLALNQAHCLLFDYTRRDLPDYERNTSANMHLLEVCAYLGIEYLIFHAGTVNDDPSFSASLSASYDWLMPFVEKGEKLGVSICIENNFDVIINDRLFRAFGARPDELIALADKLDSKNVGFCWDTGHAHIARLDQKKSVALLGKRLYTTHVHDNRGQFSCDLHIPPFYGSIDWQSFMSGLHDIGYGGTLNFELERHSLPESLIPSEFAVIRKKGEFLLEMMDE